MKVLKYLLFTALCIFNISLIVVVNDLLEKAEDFKREKEIREQVTNYSAKREHFLESNIFKVQIPITKFVQKANNKKSTIIYVYGSDECSKCVLEDITLVKAKFSKQDLSNFVFLPVLSDSRSDKIKISAMLKELKFVRLDDRDVVMPKYNGKSVRFFAILTSNMNLTGFFFPNTNTPEKTSQYLEFLKNKLTNNS